MIQRKEGFKRLTVDDMKALKAQQEIQKAVNEAIKHIDEIIEVEAEKLAQELVDSGYEADSFEIVVDNEWQAGKMIIHLKVVQEGKTLVFDMSGDVKTS
jgi:hypothetical protein